MDEHATITNNKATAIVNALIGLDCCHGASTLAWQVGDARGKAAATR